MFQRRQFPLGPWWHRRTLACQEQAMESQFQTADVQLEETKMQKCQTTLPFHFDNQFPRSSVGDELKCDFMYTLLKWKPLYLLCTICTIKQVDSYF